MSASAGTRSLLLGPLSSADEQRVACDVPSPRQRGLCIKLVLVLLFAGTAENSEGKALLGQAGCGKSAAAHHADRCLRAEVLLAPRAPRRRPAVLVMARHSARSLPCASVKAGGNRLDTFGDRLDRPVIEMGIPDLNGRIDADNPLRQRFKRQASMDDPRGMSKHDFEVVPVQLRDLIAEGFAK